jgi:hypothetical protein
MTNNCASSRLFVDILLSCGHINVIPVLGVIFTPQLGDRYTCNRPDCGKLVSVQNVGVVWRDTDPSVSESPIKQLTMDLKEPVVKNPDQPELFTKEAKNEITPENG